MTSRRWTNKQLQTYCLHNEIFDVVRLPPQPFKSHSVFDYKNFNRGCENRWRNSESRNKAPLKTDSEVTHTILSYLYGLTNSYKCTASELP